MSDSEEIKLLFKKWDTANNLLHEIDKRLALVENSSKAHDDQFIQMNTLISQNHGKTMVTLENMEKAVSELNKQEHQREGAKNLILRWLVPILSVVIAFTAIYYAN